MPDNEKCTCKCYGQNINTSLDTLIGVMTSMNTELKDIKTYTRLFLEHLIIIRKRYHGQHSYPYLGNYQ